MVQTITLPRYISAEPQLMDFGADLRPALGGKQQRASRVGSRFALALTGLQHMSDADARNLLAKLAKARTLGETVKTTWPQKALSISVGSPKVFGGGQTGSQLIVDGFPTSTTLGLHGRFFSITVGSRSYLYMVTDDPTTDSGGKATLNIAPLLRAAPTDNADLEFAHPVIEGFPDGMAINWSVAFLKHSSIPITIVEAE